MAWGLDVWGLFVWGDVKKIITSAYSIGTLFANESISNASKQDLYQNFIHRVGNDNSIQNGAHEILNNININSLELNYKIVNKNITSNNKTLLIKTNPNEKIFIKSLNLSAETADNFSFINKDDENLLSTLYNKTNKNLKPRTPIPIKTNNSLYIKSDSNINYSIEINFSILEM